MYEKKGISIYFNKQIVKVKDIGILSEIFIYFNLCYTNYNYGTVFTLKLYQTLKFSMQTLKFDIIFEFLKTFFCKISNGIFNSYATRGTYTCDIECVKLLNLNADIFA